ncbi:MAG: ribonuclease HII [Aggregatilineales bacterium]
MLRKASRTASLRHERQYAQLGMARIFGLDEAGRGPWAGPVTAAAVCLPLDAPKRLAALKGVRDSKQMTPRQRAALAGAIQATALAWGVGCATSREIDERGIVTAVKLAMLRALDAACGGGIAPDCLFVDALLLPELRHIPQVSLVGGDQRALSIAAASVLAKVWRDDYLRQLDAQYPVYGFARHKGYGTAEHQAALQAHGPCPEHRLSYAPVARCLREPA